MVHGSKPPSDEEWNAFIARTVREVNGRWVASERRGAVIYSKGGMATPRQRNQLRKLSLDHGHIPTLVLMSDSRFARGVATAMGWLVPSLKNFHALSLSQVDDAAALLTPIGSEQKEFKCTLAELVSKVEAE